MSKGKIMKTGNTFVRIETPKLLAAFFQPEDRIFQSKHFLEEISHVKSNNSLENHVQYFSNDLFLVVGIFRRKYFLIERSIFNEFR